AALPESLAESELFGTEKGAFTGADQARSGRFEEASGGTLFLDEIGELPVGLQAKLLRVLEDRTARRLGGSRDLPVDIRLVAATNRDLLAESDRGSFRGDLYFRLAVVTIHLPPLRERPGDIAVLARHLLEVLASRHGIRETALSPDAVRALEAYRWPGNVRELRNVLERALIVRGDGTIGPDDLSLSNRAERGAAPQLSKELREREAIMEALRQSRGNREEAARLLGISVRTLYYRLRSFGLS
ncbi:MAG: sigma 54-interacting transcriptional regulator, partial [Thermoanaerobaculia bacterium]|nr:sigma 54-interacting transcriptional regulator [Thermoanaerobaculia bacterium]